MLTRNDWKNLKYFTNPPFNYSCHIDLTAEATKNLKQGYRSFNMDDKWFSYCENERLYIHRSWTGHLMYCAQINNDCITQVAIVMDDFVRLSIEEKIEVFHRLIPFLSSVKTVDTL